MNKRVIIAIVFLFSFKNNFALESEQTITMTEKGFIVQGLLSESNQEKFLKGDYAFEQKFNGVSEAVRLNLEKCVKDETTYYTNY